MARAALVHMPFCPVNGGGAYGCCLGGRTGCVVREGMREGGKETLCSGERKGQRATSTLIFLLLWVAGWKCSLRRECRKLIHVFCQTLHKLRSTEQPDLHILV